MSKSNVVRFSPLPIDPSDDALIIQDDFSDLPVSSQNHYLFRNILKSILPHLGRDETKIILTQVMVALKLEGIIGRELSNREIKMANVIKDAILQEPTRKQQALKLAQNLLE